MGSKHGWSHSLLTFFNDTSKAEQNNVEARLLGHGPLNPLQNHSNEHTSWNQHKQEQELFIKACKSTYSFNCEIRQQMQVDSILGHFSCSSISYLPNKVCEMQD